MDSTKNMKKSKNDAYSEIEKQAKAAFQPREKQTYKWTKRGSAERKL